MRSLDTSWRSAGRARLGATTAPRGRISLAPALARSSLARSSLSRSTREPPTWNPIARKNVFAIAPPLSISSTLRSSASMTSMFPGPGPRVLDQRYTAAREAATGRDGGGRIGDELDGRSQDALDVPHDLLERRFRVGTLGAAEVRQEHDPRALLAQVGDRGDRGANARVVGDGTVLERDVEIHANERPPAVQGRGREIAQATLSHLRARCASRSTQRAE